VKITLVIFVLGILLFAGCIGAEEVYTPETEPGGVSASVGEPPTDQTWISPAKVMVDNFYPGARAECELQVHNGNSEVATFAVVYRHPDNVGDGYSYPIAEVQDWVIVATTSLVIAPRETRNILVSLEMPKDATVFSDKWEFWISIKDMSQVGMVRTELCSRWLVEMR
jgi:hypothetical protein